MLSAPTRGGYNLKIGTSKRGGASIDNLGFCLGRRRRNDREKSWDGRGGGGNGCQGIYHVLIVFSDVAGIEEFVDTNKSMALLGGDSCELFDVWLNVCPHQGSRTICTEEVLFIVLARLSPFIARDGHLLGGMATQSNGEAGKKKGMVAKTEDVEFSNKAVSKESSNKG